MIVIPSKGEWMNGESLTLTSLLAIMEAFSALPQLVKRNDVSQPSTLIVNNQSQPQTQRQNQNICVEVFLEAIKDEITGNNLRN